VWEQVAGGKPPPPTLANLWENRVSSMLMVWFIGNMVQQII